MTIAFDTNVLIYSCDGTEPERQAKALAILATDDEAILFWQVAVEFIAASRKLADRGMTNQQAWERLDRFQHAFRLVLPTPRVLEGARKLHVERQSTFWDALIVAACLEAGVTRLYSEDLPGRAPPEGLEIINPFA